MSQIVPVILCGGSGTRLWPRSRATKPKPFLPLVGDTTLFEATLARCPAGAGFASPVVVTGKAHLDHVEAQLGDREAAVIVEPTARNTAAAIALAALRLPDDAIMLVCPSDHHIADSGAFVEASLAAARLAGEGWLVSFGIEAKTPETGFGYLKRGEPLDAGGFRTAQFVEKPDLERARRFVADGGYAWNGGIFAFRVGDFLSELQQHRPAIADAVHRAVRNGSEDGRRFHPDAAAFGEVESESVDYAVMENTDRAAMVPADMGWSDIGNWQALHEARASDASGNSVRGRAELVDCRNVLIDSDGPRVSVIGLENVIVVVDGDDILVTSADGAQKSASSAERRINEGRSVSGVLPVRQVEKPWGRDVLPTPFGNADGRRIGEIWFEPPPELPQLLVKYIFTSQKLSVQVHPSDAQTQEAGLGRQGKDECWLILDAEPGASIGIGFTGPITAEAMRAAARDGSIEKRMVWHSVTAGDFFYLPAGTVHAIGEGVSLIEVQQNSDVTYRLFDYGRPRELHLEQGIAVASGLPYDTSLRKRVPPTGPMRLVAGPLFRLDQVTGQTMAGVAGDYSGPLLVIPRDAPARVGGQDIAPGDCALAADLREIALRPAGTYLIAQACNP